MRLLLALLAFLPLFATAQQGWVSITIQGDGYGEETTWLVRDSSDAIVAGSAPLQGAYPYVEAFLPLPVGEYTFTIYDSFGDGICCGFGEGWFSINTCVLDTTVYDFSESEMTVPFEVLACPPHGPTRQLLATSRPCSAKKDSTTSLLQLRLTLMQLRSAGI